MSKSAKTIVDDLVETESHQLRGQKIHKSYAATATLEYGAEKISTTKCWQFQVRMNCTWQAATRWLDVDR